MLDGGKRRFTLACAKPPSGLTVSGCEATALVCPSEFGRVGAANKGGSGRKEEEKKLERNLRVRE